MGTIAPVAPDSGQSSKASGSKDEPADYFQRFFNLLQTRTGLIAGVIGTITALIGALAGLATALASVASLFWPDDALANLIGIGVAIPIVALLGLLAFRLLRRRPPEGDVQEILRGPRPIEQAPLPARQAEARDLSGIVAGVAFQFGMLVGPFGSGKTSLIRAELLARLA